jgi:hypothetical protein
MGGETRMVHLTHGFSKENGLRIDLDLIESLTLLLSSLPDHPPHEEPTAGGTSKSLERNSHPGRGRTDANLINLVLLSRHLVFLRFSQKA